MICYEKIKYNNHTEKIPFKHIAFHGFGRIRIQNSARLDVVHKKWYTLAFAANKFKTLKRLDKSFHLWQSH